MKAILHISKEKQTNLSIGANEVHAHERLRARADVLATKLGIILLYEAYEVEWDFTFPP